jgi:heterodisulfide reductase subunit B
MPEYALFLGCTIQTEQYGFEMSARETLPRLGVDLIDLEGFSCCGYPLRSLNEQSWVYLTARNLAIADERGLDVLALCNGCHLSMCEIKHLLDHDPKLRDELNGHLAIEGLKYTGASGVRHLLEVLHKDVGADEIKGLVKVPLDGFKFASHYGCHALRPSAIGRPDDSEDPHILEGLTVALGAEADFYPDRLDCCGASLVVSDPEISFKLSGEKLKSVQAQGFDGMVTVCPFCHKMYDAKQGAIKSVLADNSIELPVIYYTQLLGLAMGLDQEELGINFNLSPVGVILEKLEVD